jgi:hypothetical protein
MRTEATSTTSMFRAISRFGVPTRSRSIAAAAGILQIFLMNPDGSNVRQISQDTLNDHAELAVTGMRGNAAPTLSGVPGVPSRRTGLL